MAYPYTEGGEGEELFVEQNSRPTSVSRQENIFRIFRLLKEAKRRWKGLPLPILERRELAPKERSIFGIATVVKARMVVNIFEAARMGDKRLEAGQAAVLVPGSEANVDYRLIVVTEDGRMADALCTIVRLRSPRGWHDINRTLSSDYRFWTRRSVPKEVTELETIVDALGKAVAAAPEPPQKRKK